MELPRFRVLDPMELAKVRAQVLEQENRGLAYARLPLAEPTTWIRQSERKMPGSNLGRRVVNRNSAAPGRDGCGEPCRGRLPGASV